VRFIHINEDVPLSSFDLENLRSTGEVVDDAIVWEVDDSSVETVKFLEKQGIVKVIKGDDEIDSVSDIMRLTDKVELLQGGSVIMKIYLLDHVFTLEERQLLTATAFRKQLLRLKKFIQIKPKEWVTLVNYWFDVAKDIHEPSEEETVKEKILNYLRDCTIYTDIHSALSYYTLYYNENEPGVVFCLADNLLKVVDVNRRRLRSILSDEVQETVQKRYGRARHRFWKFYIKRCGIDLDEQMYREEEEEEETEELEAFGGVGDGDESSED